MNSDKTAHPISGAFVFLLLGIFAVFSTVMALMAAKAYRGTVDRADAANRTRVASSYIRTMLRANDETGTLSIEEVNNVQTISLLNIYDDESYVTRIYVFDGMLREWFSDAEMEFDPRSGEPVCDADDMSAELKDGLLTVIISVNGAETKICYAPRAAEK